MSPKIGSFSDVEWVGAMNSTLPVISRNCGGASRTHVSLPSAKEASTSRFRLNSTSTALTCVDTALFLNAMVALWK